MLTKINILAKFITNGLRTFKSELYKAQVSHFMQYHSGGEDYNPSNNCRAMGGFLNNNPNNGVIFGYQDDVPRVSLTGEKRLYAVDAHNNIVAEIYMENIGNINITVANNCKIIAKTGVIIESPDVMVNGNLGCSTGATGVTKNGDQFVNGLCTKISQ